MADTWKGDFPQTISPLTSSGVTLRDYTHASKVFRSGGTYELAPKFKYLFHVYFYINPEAFPEGTINNYGLLVKSVKLPGFNIDTATMNQYNRKRIIQTKIKYDPIEVVFHDDNGTGIGTPNSGGSIRALWKAYYNYYYFDGTSPEVIFAGNTGAAGNPGPGEGGTTSSPTNAVYNERTQYKPSITGNTDWGYIGETTNENGVKIPFFNRVTVFGFNQHNFSAYTLINPIITRFTHDTYDYAQNTGIMENHMTLEYETVVYNEGALDGQDPSNIVTGFGSITHYDRRPSPITSPGSNSLVQGPNGLVPSFGGVVTSNKGGAGGRSRLNNPSLVANDVTKNPNTLNVAPSQVDAGEATAVDQRTVRNNPFTFPASGETTAIVGKAGVSPIAESSPEELGANPAGYQVPSYAYQQYSRNRN